MQIIPFIQLLRQSSLAYIYGVSDKEFYIYILYSIYTRIYIYIHMLENFMYKTKIKNNKLNKNVCKKKTEIWAEIVRKTKTIKKNKFYWAKPMRVSLWVGEVPQNRRKMVPCPVIKPLVYQMHHSSIFIWYHALKFVCFSLIFLP